MKHTQVICYYLLLGMVNVFIFITTEIHLPLYWYLQNKAIAQVKAQYYWKDMTVSSL